MTNRHIQTVNQVLRLEIGYNGDIGPASLMEAITEALTKSGVPDEVGVVYIRGDTPAENFIRVDIWASDAEPTIEPPTAPAMLEDVFAPEGCVRTRR